MIRYHDFNTGNTVLNDGLENYLMHGYQPGGFLTSVLANDLFMAVGRADHSNRHNLPRIVAEVVHRMPDISHGSYAAVKEWCADADGRRSYYTEHIKQEYTMQILRDQVKPRKNILDEDIPF